MTIQPIKRHFVLYGRQVYHAPLFPVRAQVYVKNVLHLYDKLHLFWCSVVVVYGVRGGAPAAGGGTLFRIEEKHCLAMIYLTRKNTAELSSSPWLA